MARITIYHGSEIVVAQPSLEKARSHNDYGPGFYCTSSMDMAREWATRRAKDGFANEYSLQTQDLKILDLNDESFCTLHWLAVLLRNRSFAPNTPLAVEASTYITTRFRIDTDPFDVMVGYRADDSYFSFSKAFLNGSINYQQLQRAMKLGDLGTQIVLKSQTAFDAIEFIGAHPTTAHTWYGKGARRDAKARADFEDLASIGSYAKGLFITDIIRGEMGADDERLR